MKKLPLLCALVMILSLFSFDTDASAATSIIIKVNGQVKQFSASLGYPEFVNNRCFVPLRFVSEQLGHDVAWDGKTNTVLIDNGAITTVIGSGRLLVQGGAIKLDTPSYQKNGRTMVPLRAVAEAFGCLVDYDAKSKTISISNKVVPYNYYDTIYYLTEVPATGAYKGWRQLKGFKGENLVNIYFRLNGNKLDYESKYKGKYNYNRTVHWVDILGRNRTTTVGELFDLQIRAGSTAYVKELYGAEFTEWLEVKDIAVYQFVNGYLEGLAIPLVGSKIDTDKTAKVDFYDETYTVSAEYVNKQWIQLKGFQGSDYFDLFFSTQFDDTNKTVSISYRTEEKGVYDFDQNISWIWFDKKIYTSKIDIYNAINCAMHTESEKIYYYYTEMMGVNNALEITTKEDEDLYVKWYYLWMQQYSYFVKEYLTQIGAIDGYTIKESGSSDYLQLSYYFTRKLSADELRFLLNHYVNVEPEKVEWYIDPDGPDSGGISLEELFTQKLFEKIEIGEKVTFYRSDPAEYKFRSEWISEKDLDDIYNVFYCIDPSRTDTTDVKADLYASGGVAKKLYALGRVPKRKFTEVFNANGIRMLYREDGLYSYQGEFTLYFNIQDLQRNGIIK